MDPGAVSLLRSAFPRAMLPERIFVVHIGRRRPPHLNKHLPPALHPHLALLAFLLLLYALPLPLRKATVLLSCGGTLSAPSTNIERDGPSTDIARVRSLLGCRRRQSLAYHQPLPRRP